ncbi:glucose-6-phosphate isomerase [Entomospira nematocerorum]|uniref:Glucose-6-phosphate isomerase n=1 Tax=Entomospira nematocerorum TaxID=2719987 RepID=A0A968KTF7_9SPIO|nr:glucose-6-phosphate isomerase [Entomospira nematocera]NIZ47356.1 glucose-6-phosphate isomerase [Entomospira nematocera]WDI34103.1 glucose-6-phosphate isomerase [Entomospira nematocera]
MINFHDLHTLKSFQALKTLPIPSVADNFTAIHVEEQNIDAGGGLTYNYSAKGVNEELLEALQALADEQQVIDKYELLLSGEMMNTGEKRKVLHHLTRAQQANDVIHEGTNLRQFYHHEQKRIAEFAQRIHTGEITGSTDKKITTVVQVGIGGSDLGPRALYLALQNLYLNKLEAKFISNVDPDDATAIIESCDLERTLFILVSKSGTTQETLANQNFVLQAAKKQNILHYDVMKHMVCVTSQTSPLAKDDRYLASFFIDDFIGGRYSSTSAVGGVILSLAFGAEVFEELLIGAAEADSQAREQSITENAALLDALLGVYERNIKNYAATAILPYSQALSRFPAHLQQLDMESNGKSVNRDGQAISYATGPVLFGEPGTNGQHSFYQLLHQGSDVIPLQFIGFTHSQCGVDYDYEASSSQKKLNANLIAQIAAFALGHTNNENMNKNFEGGRPASLIYAQQLTARALGALLAHYENKVMFQGFIWNLNSFDQEGVQLGKVLANDILHGNASSTVNQLFQIIQ